jgi:hypothetical protein
MYENEREHKGKGWSLDRRDLFGTACEISTTMERMWGNLETRLQLSGRDEGLSEEILLDY